MEERPTSFSSVLPRWTLFAVLFLGPFGLLPIALSRRTDPSTRLLVALPIILATVPLLILAFALLFLRAH